MELGFADTYRCTMSRIANTVFKSHAWLRMLFTVPYAQSVLTLKYDLLKHAYNNTMYVRAVVGHIAVIDTLYSPTGTHCMLIYRKRAQIWDFIGVESLDEIIDTDSDGVIEEAAVKAMNQFHMTANHALEVTNLDKLSRIEIIKAMQNDSWRLGQPSGCSIRRFVFLCFSSSVSVSMLTCWPQVL